MSKTPGWIRKFHKPAAETLPPLVLFPHAGSGASTYRTFSKRLSADFDVLLVQYPGRQDRAAEPMATSIAELAEGALAAFLESPHRPDVPITVFGHSMGAVVAFEFVRRAESVGIEVGVLGVSSAVAPPLVVDQPPHPSEDEALLDRLAALDGTGSDLLANREIMRMALPVLKADYRAFDSYVCAADIQVQARIQALGGADDEVVTPAHLRAWASHSRNGYALMLFDGGHFYLHDHVDGIAEVLAEAAMCAR
ncbi:alpha/beta fold hydrolase [Nocardia sp. NBC_00508]|uniref:thioesterase II family protein n=1 Tax=Nocardia sp. NBC_00508 TaxID=2975992 RepID=UPI002E7FC5B1|nr:alpha/beta fold hydrolase [Nocardia sp. NBC_00508]WUD69807.1 alpha/beta fold hydrolase [Nocardia sp. NBC_00508]